MSFLLVPVAQLMAGCDGPATGAGGATRVLKPATAAIPAVQNVSEPGAHSSDLRDVPHVPASSAVTLPDEPGGEAIYHEAKAGDTPSRVAREYRTTAEKLLRHNGLDASAEFEQGQLLAIPP
ncbi:MAG: LysM peptidoglycan-binding domain-containing protein [Planctomycetaceae bacterium]